MSKTVFIIGSGFSKDLFNYPTLGELSKLVLERLYAISDSSVKERSAQRTVNFISGKLADFVSTGVFPSPLRNNIEHLMTYLYQSYPWRSETENAYFRGAYHVLAQAIVDVLTEVEKTNLEKMSQNDDIGLDFIRYCHSAKSTIITFNYDTVIEKYVENKKLITDNHAASFGDIYRIPIVDILNRTNTLVGREPVKSFSLLKLHGSINWHYSGSAEFSGEQIYYSLAKYSDPKLEASAIKSKEDLAPLIIPPVLDKSVFYKNSAICLQWKLAKDALIDAENVFILGYSLPVTDLSTSFLFRESLRQSKTNVTVINKGGAIQSAGEIQTHYEDVFQELWGGKFEYIDVGEGSSVAKLMSLI